MADSYHASVHTMLEELRENGEDSVFDRMDAQGKRCQFCEQGIRCSLCSQGPCRISARASRGVCGIDADGMAMRNFLLQNTMGTAAYTYHAGEVMKTLAQATPGGTYEIKDWSKLELLAKVVGEEVEPKDTLPKRVADAVWAEFNRDHQSPSPLVEAFAPKERVETWKKLGIMPGGVLHEHVRCATSSMTNIDGDYVSLALKGLRLGLATAYGAQVPLELAQDALFGTPAAARRQGRPRHPRPSLRQRGRERARADDGRGPHRRRPPARPTRTRRRRPAPRACASSAPSRPAKSSCSASRSTTSSSA